MPSQNFDEQMMRKCFSLALKAKGKTTPNPLVGCVITKNEQILATGYHQKAGSSHAELDAIHNCQETLAGTTFYVNLEPCCHTNKRTPPCAQRLIQEKVKKVVISNLDPNPQVAGRGVQLLQEAGIEVKVGLLEEEGAYLNRVFFHHIKTKIPYVHLKWAQTKEGFIADQSGDSKWISNELARTEVHELRLEYDAIMIGAGTLRKDNPSLTARKEEQVLKCPKRIILLGKKPVDLKLKLFHDAYKEENIIALFKDHPQREALAKFNLYPYQDFSYPDFLSYLYSQGITSLLVEGGSHLIQAFTQQKLYQEITIYQGIKSFKTGIKALLNPVNLEDFHQSDLGNNIRYHQNLQ